MSQKTIADELRAQDAILKKIGKSPEERAQSFDAFLNARIRSRPPIERESILRDTEPFTKEFREELTIANEKKLRESIHRQLIETGSDKLLTVDDVLRRMREKNESTKLSW